MTSILITGANRGLGLEFARQCSAVGWRVFACCRNPEDSRSLAEIAENSGGRLSVHALDVKDHAQVERLAGQLRDEPLDILLNNAGIYGPPKMPFGQIDYATWADVLAVNTMAPMKMAECFIDHVSRSRRKIIACISSQMGSIAENDSGGHYLYRSSKAALNMVVKNLAVDLRERQIIAVSISPGWVQTDMGGPSATLTPAESIRGMLQVITGLQLQDSGKFLSYDGHEIPW